MGLLDGYATRQRGLLDDPDPITRMWHNLPDQGGGNTVPRPTVQSEAAQMMREIRGETPSMGVNVVRGFTEGPAATRYVRRSLLSDTPFNPGAPGMAMFAETSTPRTTLDALKQYGPNAWISRGDGATDVRTLQPAIVRALREAGAHQEMNTTAAALARDANPPRIVDSAGLWDNPSLVETIWGQVLEPRGITAVRTNDGLLIFDPSHARPVRAP